MNGKDASVAADVTKPSVGATGKDVAVVTVEEFDGLVGAITVDPSHSFVCF